MMMEKISPAPMRGERTKRSENEEIVLVALASRVANWQIRFEGFSSFYDELSVSNVNLNTMTRADGEIHYVMKADDECTPPTFFLILFDSIRLSDWYINLARSDDDLQSHKNVADTLIREFCLFINPLFAFHLQHGRRQSFKIPIMIAGRSHKHWRAKNQPTLKDFRSLNLTLGSRNEWKNDFSV